MQGKRGLFGSGSKVNIYTRYICIPGVHVYAIEGAALSLLFVVERDTFANLRYTAKTCIITGERS